MFNLHPLPKRAAKGLLLPSLVGLVLIPLLLITVALVIRSEFSRGRELRAEVNYSYEARLEMQVLMSLMQDAETGQRGYVITGQTSFLEPYERALLELEDQRELIRRQAMAVATPAAARQTQEELARLDSLIDRKLANMKYSIDLKAANDPRVDAIIATGGGKALMDEVRASITQLSRAESRALGRRIAADAERTGRTEMVTLGLFSTLGVLLLGAFLLILRQVHSRQALLDQVQSNAARLSGIFENAQDGLLTFNRSGTIEAINRAGQGMFGLETGDIQGRDAGLIFDLPDNGKVFLERLSGESTSPQGLTRELTGRRRDGSTFPAEVSLGTFHLADGPHVVAAVRDISDRRRVERLKAEFVSTVSHELRTPLTSIAGSLGLLAGGAAGALPERAARLISIGYSNCQRLVRLINDILDIEKIESGQMSFGMQPVDVQTVVKRGIDGTQGLAEGSGVSFRLDAATAGAEVRGDEDRLVQVVTNLLSNAAKFSPPGGVVDIRVVQTGQSLRLSVSDQGPGVPDEFRSRIFSKFAQADGSDTRRLGGTGLGLAISREIVERHGGRIWLEPVSGQGATFHVELPSAAAAESPARSGALTVLICEDDAHAAEILQGLVAQLGLASRIVSTLAAAEAALTPGHGYSALLLDLRLPDGSGVDLLQRMRAREADTKLPVLIVSGEAGSTPRGLDIVDWLQKPVDIKRLHGALGQAGLHDGDCRPLILHVEDDPDIRQVVAGALGAYCDVVSAESLKSAREVLKTIRPQLAILDIALGDGSGLELISDLRRQDGDRVGVVVFSAQEIDDKAIAASVDQVLTKSCTSLDELSSMVRRLVLAKPQAEAA